MKEMKETNNTEELDFDFDDIESRFEERTPNCKVLYGEIEEYANIVDCAKEKGDQLAKAQGENILSADITVYYEGKAIAFRKYVCADFEEDKYRAFLQVIDPYRSEELPIDPIISETGYFTDWIEIR